MIGEWELTQTRIILHYQKYNSVNFYDINNLQIVNLSDPNYYRTVNEQDFGEVRQEKDLILHKDSFKYVKDTTSCI